MNPRDSHKNRIIARQSLSRGELDQEIARKNAPQLSPVLGLATALASWLGLGTPVALGDPIPS
jgi:hypothetical protein